jgi:hypothetical protein
VTVLYHHRNPWCDDNPVPQYGGAGGGGFVAMVVASRAAVGDGARRLPPAALRLAAWLKRRQLHKEEKEAAMNVVAMVAAELAGVWTAGPQPPRTLPS